MGQIVLCVVLCLTVTVYLTQYVPQLGGFGGILPRENIKFQKRYFTPFSGRYFVIFLDSFTSKTAKKPWTGPACLNVGYYEGSNLPKRQIRHAKSKTTARLIHNVIF